ncbi:uncharacterized protein LOC125518787 [Triticum urartu]|uniref:uncharacterized protein LOC125518739 n=1 Tax=Triticum urartu TaxID=4572 RepID=UPI002042FAD9|nr:uncharacterized protein LOC125518739 [Triticum urartu]XP_048539613.1 uncharacterized protein LOC125518787 [Triticum urartu]
MTLRVLAKVTSPHKPKRLMRPSETAVLPFCQSRQNIAVLPTSPEFLHTADFAKITSARALAVKEENKGWKMASEEDAEAGKSIEQEFLTHATPSGFAPHQFEGFRTMLLLLLSYLPLRAYMILTQGVGLSDSSSSVDIG